MLPEENKSMTMSLAEGIVKRDKRLRNEFPENMSSIYVKVNVSDIRKRPKKVKYLETLLDSSNCYWCIDPSEKSKALDGYLVWALMPDGDFKLHILKLSKRGLAVEPYNILLKHHALARIVYRCRLFKLRDAFEEVMSNSIGMLITGLQLKGLGEEATFPTAHGVGFMKRDITDNACIVTWVDDAKLSREQILYNNGELALFESSAKIEGVTVREFLEKLDGFVVSARRRYPKETKELITDAEVYDFAVDYMTKIDGETEELVDSRIL